MNKDKVTPIRMSDSYKNRVKRASNKANMSLSEFIIAAIDRLISNPCPQCNGSGWDTCPCCKGRGIKRP